MAANMKNLLRLRRKPDPALVHESEKELDGTSPKSDTTSTHASDDVENATAIDDPDAQAGVKLVEAVTMNWSKNQLRLVYIAMWFVYFINGLFSSITGNLSAYVLSGYESHSLVPVIGIVSGVMSAAMFIPLSKVLDLWGRAEGAACMVALAVLGQILMASTTNVSTYCAATVLSTLGLSGLIYSVDVITADTSKLKNRALAYAFTSSPYIITALGGPKAAEAFYEEISWRWAFGIFTIILPVVASPLIFIIWRFERRAKKSAPRKESSGRTIMQSVWHHAMEFDAGGVILFAAGLVLFLLPFSLADPTDANKWKSPTIVAMLVVGFVLLIAFGLYETFVAPKPMVSYNMLLTRNVALACTVDICYQISYYAWASYFSSVLQVVYDLSIANAGYVTGIFDMISGVWLFVVGYAVSRSGYFKWVLCIAVPLYMLAVGLLIYFRHAGTNIGFIIMTQVFNALGGGCVILVQQTAITSAVSHQEVAAALALLYVAGNIGGSLGSTIAGAIWTNGFPVELQRLLPAEVADQWADIYGDLSLQIAEPIGTPVRDAIIEAYVIVQRRMLIAGLCITVGMLASVVFMKNTKLTAKEQAKGTLF